jgi:hypothetical protein
MTVHSAVLAEVPYFQKLLHQDWASKSFGLSNKLEVQLPCDVSQEAVGHFLRHVYGDPQALKKVDPTAAPLLQVNHLGSKSQASRRFLNEFCEQLGTLRLVAALRSESCTISLIACEEAAETRGIKVDNFRTKSKQRGVLQQIPCGRLSRLKIRPSGLKFACLSPSLGLGARNFPNRNKAPTLAEQC